MMWVKICGLNQLEIARSIVNDIGHGIAPDAVGLNFYSRSKRKVSPEVAAEIVSLVPETILPVGLFVNHSHAEIRKICRRCGITTIQLHGDETPEFAAELAEFEIMRAFRVGEAGLDAVARQLERFHQLGVRMTRCIVDSQVTGAYGGTGHRAPWDLLKRDWQPGWPQLVLAGGLTADNVAEAIQAANPHGVDVASGVESSPGKQDPELIRRFIQKARGMSLH